MTEEYNFLEEDADNHDDPSQAMTFLSDHYSTTVSPYGYAATTENDFLDLSLGNHNQISEEQLNFMKIAAKSNYTNIEPIIIERIDDSSLSEIVLGSDLKHSPEDQISFTGKYTENEIRRMEEEVRNCSSEVSRLKSSVHSHENRVNNADTHKGHENGSYAQELSELNREKSRLNNALSKFKDATTKLNNAR